MSYNPFSLEGKTVLLTGASSGIGRAAAIECSKLGAKVVITGRNEERLNKTFGMLEGDGHTCLMCELTSQVELEQLVNSMPKLDGVVLCAGKGMTQPVLFSSREKFETIFDVNFFAPVELLRLLCKKKKMSSPSSAVFIVSVGGTMTFNPGNSVYGASKAALKSMINFFAVELGHKKIRVNGISPGMVETPLIQSGKFTDEQRLLDMKKYPLERYGMPEEIAHAIAFLLSDASSWITGHCLVIDGGLSAN